MYVLVHHRIYDPKTFWSLAEWSILNMPARFMLHHTLSAKDGHRATCLWEADSVESVRRFLEPVLGAVSVNEYAEAENREGIAVPSRIRHANAAIT